MGPSEYPGWMEDEFGTLTLSVTVAGDEIRLATVRKADEMDELWETYIGLPFERRQLGRWDASRDRAVKKAEEFLLDKLRRLL